MLDFDLLIGWGRGGLKKWGFPLFFFFKVILVELERKAIVSRENYKKEPQCLTKLNFIISIITNQIL